MTLFSTTDYLARHQHLCLALIAVCVLIAGGFMSGQQKCCAKIEAKTIWESERSACTKNAKVERDGMHYCGFHDPVARKEKQKARDDAARKKVAEEMRVHRIKHAAPDLLAALRLTAAVCAGDSCTKSELISALEAARAAIRKATGEKE